MNATKILVALLRLPGMGRKTALKLLSGFPIPVDLEDVVSRWIGKNINRQTIQEALDYADIVCERSEKEGIRIVTMFDVEYPRLLTEIDDPPILLHVKGSLIAAQSTKTVAIIGTREPTSFGSASARRIGETVALHGISVVSGLARGCDAEAHWGCLAVGGKAVAIMAHGLDKIYPAENKNLAAKILANSGCLISEYEVGKPAFKTAFIERDRLQSGMSKVVILVETGLTGGSHHTIRFARQQSRIVACVAHPDRYAYEEKSMGNAKLIKDKQAIPLHSSSDLQNLLNLVFVQSDLVASTEEEVPKIQLSMFH